MKKLLGILLVLMMIISLVACGGAGNQGDNSTGTGENGTDNNGEGEWIVPDDGGSNVHPDDGNNQQPEHTHSFVDGKCECGETDPSYIPPHTHNFVGGKCSCGETDPNYVPPTPEIDPNPNIVTVYLLNRAEWERVAIYYWNNDGEMNGGWPGIRLHLGEDGLYRATFDSVYLYLIFNNDNRGAQTSDLVVPTDDEIVYDNVYNCWITYEEAIIALGGGNQEHTHNFINGKCECGEIDHNYIPPHVHIFVNGKCECGEVDPNYVPPHVHNFVNGKCECGEIDPNYVPPHIHNYVEGKCECGATDPNYIPNVPHTHNFVEGVCVCGEIDPNYVPPHNHNFVDGKCQCGETDPNYVPPTPDPDQGGITDPTNQAQVFDALFNAKNHISIKLDISNSELKKIQQDYEYYSSRGSKSPIYRMADMIITITEPSGNTFKWTIPQVGVRMKGNTSRTSFYSDNDGMYNLIHFKISFQETFDDADYYGKDALTWTDSAAKKERKDRTFATLEKIDLRWNRNDDTTYIRENYAYELYREFGVLAPHTTLCSMDIGKDHAGVFVLYEPVDKIFLEKNLPTTALGGDLYKLGWTHEGATFTSFSNYGVEDEDAGKFFVYDLKTNKKTSTHQSLKNLINTLNSSSLTKEKFASVVDIENFMYYCAVSYMIGNPDDLRNNYNNTYIYFRPDTGKVIFIPYDMDRGLGVNTWNPTGHGMTKDDPFNKKALGNGDQRNPLFLKSICSGGMFINEFTEALKVVDNSDMLTNESFKEAFDTAAALYTNDAKPSKNYHNANGFKFKFDINRTCSIGDSKNMSFADYISAKRETLYSKIGDLGNNQGGGSGGVIDPDPVENAEPYIMGDMNGWQQNEQYAMKSNGDGTFSFTLTKSHVSSTNNRIKFKIYDSNNNVWYGYEIVDPNCTINYNDSNGNGNGNKNIYIQSGTYLVTFDANTVTLYIEKIG